MDKKYGFFDMMRDLVVFCLLFSTCCDVNSIKEKTAALLSQLEQSQHQQVSATDSLTTTPSDTIALPLEGTHIPSL